MWPWIKNMGPIVLIRIFPKKDVEFLFGESQLTPLLIQLLHDHQFDSGHAVRFQVFSVQAKACDLKDLTPTTKKFILDMLHKSLNLKGCVTGQIMAF